MNRSDSVSFDRAKRDLVKHNLESHILVFEESSRTVSEAALTVGVSEAEIAKTLSFYVDEKPILIVAAGDVKIDNAKYKQFFGKKAKMIPFEEVEEVIGHKVGGVCPFGVNPGVDIFLDVSLKEYECVYPACGTGNSAVKLSIKELEDSSNYKEWIDVCKR